MKVRAPGRRTRAGDDFLNDDAHRDSPDRAAPQDFLVGSDADRDWFARHHGRHHRIRGPIGAEVLLCPPGDGIPLIVVKQVRPGERVRAPIRWRNDPVPLNSEQTAALMFAIAAGTRRCPESAP